MNTKNQKKIVANLLGVGKNRVKLNPDKLADIKEAITKSDLRSLLATNSIKVKKVSGQSRFASRKIKIQKRQRY